MTADATGETTAATSEETDAVAAAAADAPPRDRLGANYFKLFGASTISNLGDGMGTIAYPWLASAVTRNPVLIALVAVVQRLPWLIFSLPAGVITDRMSRRTLMIRANSVRFVLTLAVAFVVLAKQGQLPGPDELSESADAAIDDLTLYIVIVIATLLLGVAEVFYDNAAQTFMPSIVHKDNLEKANGRLWSVEQVTNTFAGPPIAALLLAIAFSAPFYVDAASFLVSAVLIMLIPAAAADRRASPSTATPSAPPEPARAPSWRAELKEGFSWLWQHELLRPMAIILGLLNALGMMSGAILVLFAQEVLDTSPTEFAIMNFGGAIGGIIGGWTASIIAKRIGSGPSLWLTLIGGGISTAAIGLFNTWVGPLVMFAIYMLLAVLWNVITVSLRQSIIPDQLLGRVNSVYRFFAWGMMPIGSILGGAIVAITEVSADRELSLRMPFFVAGALHLALFVFAAPKLTTAKIEAARAAADPAPAVAGAG
ncbi:MAG: MFS transporter, partial [Actinomycetota bacterium]